MSVLELYYRHQDARESFFCLPQSCQKRRLLNHVFNLKVNDAVQRETDRTQKRCAEAAGVHNMLEQVLMAVRDNRLSEAAILHGVTQGFIYVFVEEIRCNLLRLGLDADDEVAKERGEAFLSS